MKDLTLLSNTSGNWDIYRAPGNESFDALIVRFPKMMSSGVIDQFLKNYNLVKMANLPTVKYLEKYDYNSRKGIITEDLNYQQDRMYVTYNSVYGNSRKQLDLLKPDSEFESKRMCISEYEEYRYQNKLEKILDFHTFIDQVKISLFKVSEQSLIIEYDAYFFGTEKLAKVSTIDFKVVDLDHIYLDTGKSKDEVCKINLEQFQRAISGFVKYFVEVQNQSIHLKFIEKQIGK